MAGLFVTEHAGRRLAQRSIQLRDADLIVLIGTEVSDGYLVRDKDCEAVEHQIKRVLDRIRRLRGKRLVVVDGSIVTGYHATPRKQRGLLGRAEKRNIAAS